MMLVLSGCTESGTNVTAAQAAQFVPGKTTEADVTNKLGQPDSTLTADNGHTSFTYAHLTNADNPVGFVPIVGIFAGGGTSSNNRVTFTFDQNGVLISKSSLVSHSTSNGLIPG